MPTPKSMTMDRLRSAKKPSKCVVWIPLNEDLAETYEDVETMLDHARARYRIIPEDEAARAEVDRLEDEFEELRAEMRKPANSIKFVFQSLGPKKYDDLQDQYPLTEEEKQEYKDKGIDPDILNFSVDRFAPALIAACCIEPVMDLAFVTDEIMNCTDGTWSSGDFKNLYSSAIEANVRIRSVNLGKEFKRTPVSKKS